MINPLIIKVLLIINQLIIVINSRIFRTLGGLPFYSYICIKILSNQQVKHISMIQISYNTRAFIKAEKQQIAIRVRWNNKTREVTFITGMYGDQEKWDNDQHKAKKGTTHIIRGRRYTAVEINERIAMYREEINAFFNQCATEDRIPSPEELKATVNAALNPKEEMTQPVEKMKSMKELFSNYMQVNSREKNWNSLVREKYTQAFKHLMSAVPNLKANQINKEVMLRLRDWYVKKQYMNTTINHRFTVIKALFKWISENTIYKVPADVFTFKTNLKEAPNTITFLTYDELQQFLHFPLKSKHLEKARDQFCFMAFTSLRISDFRRLMVANIVNEHIEIVAKKTDERMVIPLIKDALALIEKYKDSRPADGHLFDVISGQKLNDYIKEAAKEAGLTRKVLFSYYQGNTRIDEQKEFWEIISCHDARRTFVTCSLAMGIPENYIRRCSGHKNLRTMAPYMGVGLEAQTLEMEKWDKAQYRSKIISLLDKMPQQKLEEALHLLEGIAG